MENFVSTRARRMGEAERIMRHDMIWSPSSSASHFVDRMRHQRSAEVAIKNDSVSSSIGMGHNLLGEMNTAITSKHVSDKKWSDRLK